MLLLLLLGLHIAVGRCEDAWEHGCVHQRAGSTYSRSREGTYFVGIRTYECAANGNFLYCCFLSFSFLIFSSYFFVNHPSPSFPPHQPPGVVYIVHPGLNVLPAPETLSRVQKIRSLKTSTLCNLFKFFHLVLIFISFALSLFLYYVQAPWQISLNYTTLSLKKWQRFLCTRNFCNSFWGDLLRLSQSQNLRFLKFLFDARILILSSVLDPSSWIW